MIGGRNVLSLACELPSTQVNVTLFTLFHTPFVFPHTSLPQLTCLHSRIPLLTQLHFSIPHVTNSSLLHPASLVLICSWQYRRSALGEVASLHTTLNVVRSEVVWSPSSRLLGACSFRQHEQQPLLTSVYRDLPICLPHYL